MLNALLCLIITLLTAWALIYPGGPLGFILLYRVSYYVAASVRTGTKNTSIDSFGALLVEVPNGSFLIKQDKDVHHRLLDNLARRLAEGLGYKRGTALIGPLVTRFKFTRPN